MDNMQTAEIFARIGLNGEPFIPEDWTFNPVTMYFEHKTKNFIRSTAGKNDDQKIPYMLSANYVHELTH